MRLGMDKRKTLLVSGCSFTKRMPGEDNVERRWCDVVADKLDMNLVNIGFSGAGNEYIFRSIYDYLKDNPKPDMVIAAWSQSQRRDYWLNDRPQNDRTDLRGDKKYWIKKTNTYKELMLLVCRSRSIKYHGFQMIELFHKDRDNVQAKTIGFLDKADENFVSEGDRHPSEIGHEIIGNYIYENL